MQQGFTKTGAIRALNLTALQFCLGVALVMFAGCGTTTNRMATEQLLMSDAVDQAISQIDFQYLDGKKVFLDTLYLHSVKGVGFVNSEYIISSLRQQLTASNCLIQDTRESADVIVEPRVGALGTDGHEVVYGIPQSGSLSTAAAILSSASIPAIPEVSVGKSNAQSGIAKVIVFAYDRETREPIWQSGIAKAESTSSNTWFLGAGPFQKGSIYEGMRFAGQQLPPPPHFDGGVLTQRNPHVFRRLRSEELSVSDLELEPEPEHSMADVEYSREHFFDHDELLEKIPAAPHPDEIAESSNPESATPSIQQATFEEDVVEATK